MQLQLLSRRYRAYVIVCVVLSMVFCAQFALRSRTAPSQRTVDRAKEIAPPDVHPSPRDDSSDIPSPPASVAAGTAPCPAPTPLHDFSSDPVRDDVRFVTATRFWGRDRQDLTRLRDFLTTAVSYSDVVLVAVRSERDKMNSVQFVASLGFSAAKVKVLPISIWGMVSSALNVLLIEAARMRAQYLLYQSVELAAQSHHVELLKEHMDELTIVAGAAIGRSHRFVEGRHTITGLNTPWNTLALWHVPTLMRTGFLPMSDGVGYEGAADEPVPTAADLQHPGLEEVPAITLLQLIANQQLERPDHTVYRKEAKLVLMPDDLRWNADFVSESRQSYHDSKMESKRTLGQRHLGVLNLPPGNVQHVVPDQLRQQFQTRIPIT